VARLRAVITVPDGCTRDPLVSCAERGRERREITATMSLNSDTKVGGPLPPQEGWLLPRQATDPNIADHTWAEKIEDGRWRPSAYAPRFLR